MEGDHILAVLSLVSHHVAGSLSKGLLLARLEESSSYVLIELLKFVGEERHVVSLDSESGMLFHQSARIQSYDLDPMLFILPGDHSLHSTRSPIKGFCSASLQVG